MEMVLLPFKLFLSPTRLCLLNVHQFAKADLFPRMFTSNINVRESYQIFHMQYIPDEVINSFHEGTVRGQVQSCLY